VRSWPKVSGVEAIAEQVSLSALDGAACRLRVTREELAVASSSERVRFLREHRVSDRALQEALRSGLRRAILEARRGGALTPEQASLAQAGVGILPIDVLIDAVSGGKGVLDALSGLLGG